MLFVNSHNPFLYVEEQKINTTQVTPQRLFDHSWQVIKNEYYDPNFNDQYWLRWKNHYRGKIKTLDEVLDDLKLAEKEYQDKLNFKFEIQRLKQEMQK